MNIQDLVYDVIVEEVKNKKLFNFLLKKWYGDNPTPEQIQQTENDLTLFFEKQHGMTSKNPAVISFLHRWDGQHGLGVKVPDLDENGVQKRNDNNEPMFKLAPFKLEDIKDPVQFTLEQFEDFLHEYKDATLTAGDEDEFKGKLESTPAKVTASKKLWDSDRDVVLNEEGFKVHFVSDARESIKYGFYQQKMAEKYGGVQWCVTGRNTSDSRSNLWGTYRPRRTFWFVIDESKNPIDNPNKEVYKYHICALQYCERDQGYTGFKMTSMLNDGDIPKSWEEVVRIYPQLAEHRDMFEYVAYDEAELFDRNMANRLTEAPGRHEFARQRRELKKAYLDGGGVISTEKSWMSMDTNLRNLYILTVTARDAVDKFSSYELMSAIKKVGNEFRLLDNTLKSVGSRQDQNGRISNQSLADLGVAYIYQHLMEHEFITARASIDNPKIRLYKSKKTKKTFGLYNLGKIDWVIHEGIKFEPHYTEMDTILYLDDNDKKYLVEIYVVGENGPVDNRSLYCVYPIEDDNELVGGHFIGARQWAEIEGTKMRPKDEENDDDDSRRFSNLNPETDVDIKEMY